MLNKIIILLTTFLTTFKAKAGFEDRGLISDLTIEYALNTFLGKPYKWGGQSPWGVDCSGLVILLLQADGKLPKGFDTNAQGLYTYFIVNGAYEAPTPRRGCLIFYGKSKKQITHVGICLNDFQIIEASGGDSTTTTVERAIEQDAFVRISPYNSRSDIVAIVHSDIGNVLPFAGRKHSKNKLTD